MGRMNTDDFVQGYPPGFAEALGRTIKVMRTDLGVARRALAEQVGISYSYLTEIENGNKPPSPSVLGPIAHALGLHMFELIEAAEGRMVSRMAEPAAPAPDWDQRPPEPDMSARATTRTSYSMQPSLRGARRDVRGAVIELERLVRHMAPEDVERLLDFARRLAR